MQYRRARTRGATYFFTVNLHDRQSSLLTTHIDLLRASMRHVRRAHPFDIVAIVILPDHLHAIWRLPAGDADFALRWSLIKAGFSRNLAPVESVGQSRRRRRERAIWQRRYWEHRIRDEDDLHNHINYVHFNPVKHGYVADARDWPYSSIHRVIVHGVR